MVAEHVEVPARNLGEQVEPRRILLRPERLNLRVRYRAASLTSSVALEYRGQAQRCLGSLEARSLSGTGRILDVEAGVERRPLRRLIESGLRAVAHVPKARKVWMSSDEAGECLIES
ncbi:MAG: hypothetical protein ABI640_17120 [Gammaproteobacteria bacterium]